MLIQFTPSSYCSFINLGCRKNNKIKYNIKSKKKLYICIKYCGIKDLEKSFAEKPSENPIFLCRSLFITIFIFFIGNKVQDFSYTNRGQKTIKKYKDYLIKP